VGGTIYISLFLILVFPLKKIKKKVFGIHATVVSGFTVLGLEVYVMIWITFLLL
jgi:hypothetical protein